MKKLIFYALFACTAFTACNKIYDDSIHRNVLEGIRIDSTSLKMFIGEKRQIPLVTTPANFSLDSLRLYSSDTAVLKISKTGLISALAEGTSRVTVSNLDSTKSASVVVTVVDPNPDSLLVGLIAYYPFNNNTLVDESGNNNHGTAHNVFPTTDRNNKAESAYQFNGTSSHITINDTEALRLNNTDFTLNMWVKLDSYIEASGSSLLSKNAGPYQQGWNCSIVGTTNQDGASPGNLFYNVSGGTDPFAAGNMVIDTASWHMLTITYELGKKEISLYLDGVLDSHVREIPTPNPNTSAKLHIGNNSLLDINEWANPYFFHGKIDDIRIYNRKISAPGIVDLYNRDN